MLLMEQWEDFLNLVCLQIGKEFFFFFGDFVKRICLSASTAHLNINKSSLSSEAVETWVQDNVILLRPNILSFHSIFGKQMIIQKMDEEYMLRYISLKASVFN